MLLALLASGGFIVLRHHTAPPVKNASLASDSIFDARIAAATNFPLYQPGWMPSGFTADARSVSQPQEGVVIFNLTGAQGEKIYVSEEGRSKTYDYGGFFKRIENNEQFKTGLGQAVVGHTDSGKTTIGSVVSENTWIIINGRSDTLNKAEAKKILQSFAGY
jgi:hypothetical protein